MNLEDASKPFRLIGKYFIEIHENHPIIAELISKSGIQYELNHELTFDTRMILVDTSGRSIFVWENANTSLVPNSIECVFFWNDSSIKSVRLIKDASYLATLKWQKRRQFTRIHPNPSPGNVFEYYSFKEVGWKLVGKTDDARYVLQFIH